MLFQNGVFCPEAVGDARVRAALHSAAAVPREVLRPVDLLAGMIRQGNGRVTDPLSKALKPGGSLQDLLAGIENGQILSEGTTVAPRTRASFTALALKALDEFAASLGEADGVLDGVAPEVLSVCLLANLDEMERRSLPALDAERAISLLWRRVAGGLNLQPLVEKIFRNAPEVEAEASSEEELVLPPEVVPSEDLTRLARTAAGDGPFPFDGEEQFERLFEEVTRALHRSAHHVLLVGERGVGKSTVAAELARRAAAGVIPSLASRRFLRVDCRHIPPDETRERLDAILARVAGRPELVVILDGFASLLRTERGASNRTVLLAALQHAHCRLVLLLSPHEYEELLSDDADLVECFTRVEVAEPDPEVALKLLRRFAQGLSRQYRVTVDDEAVRQAVLLSANYILNDQLPSKALKVLHRACEDLDYERGQRGGKRELVTADDVVRIVSERSGVPEGTLRGIAEHSDFERGLREFIVGQDHAVREVATELGLIKAGMTDTGKPASVMLFLGQTGTGKTEMAKALARLYSTSGRLRSYTLGNCVEPHSVATIIGVPPGYVGHHQGGRLVNDLNADPYCVVLLDEADKAHPDVLQPFLNLFDEGWVADQRGVRAHGDRAIFILTTNVGQRMIAEMVEQGKSAGEIRERMKEVLAQIRHTKADRPVFTPEFLSRLKRIIVFNSLNQQAMEGIAGKLVAELQQSWIEKRGKALEVAEALVRHVADEAHRLNEKSKGREGGRIVRKLISDWVESPLQRAISARPAEYRASEAVALDFVPPDPAPSGEAPRAPAVSIRFGPRNSS